MLEKIKGKIDETILKLKNKVYKPTLGKIYEVNCKFISKEKCKLLLEVLNHNGDEIKRYVFPEVRSFKSHFNFNELCFMITKTNTFKCKQIIPGILFSFTCDKEDIPDSEFELSIPKNEYELKYPQASLTINYNFESKNYMRRYRMLKTMLKTNRCRVVEEFSDDGKQVTLINTNPKSNIAFWGTIRFFTKQYLKDIGKLEEKDSGQNNG